MHEEDAPRRDQKRTWSKRIKCGTSGHCCFRGSSYLLAGGPAILAAKHVVESAFANGNVQVVDFNEKTHKTGIYKLLDFTGDRQVMTVRSLMKSESDTTKLAVYLGK